MAKDFLEAYSAPDLSESPFFYGVSFVACFLEMTHVTEQNRGLACPLPDESSVPNHELGNILRPVPEGGMSDQDVELEIVYNLRQDANEVPEENPPGGPAGDLAVDTQHRNAEALIEGVDISRML